MATTHKLVYVKKTPTRTNEQSQTGGIKRSKFAIIADILRQSRIPTKKTHIMYKCNLSFHQLKRYLQFMQKQALLRKNEQPRGVMYQTTKKGNLFLTRFRVITRLLKL